MKRTSLIQEVAEAVVSAIVEIGMCRYPIDEHSQILGLFDNKMVKAKIQKMLDEDSLNH